MWAWALPALGSCPLVPDSPKLEPLSLKSAQDSLVFHSSKNKGGGKETGINYVRKGIEMRQTHNLSNFFL